MKSKQHESSISLGIFTCEIGLVTGSGSFDQAVEVFSGLFSIAFSRFCCTVLMITRWKMDYRNMSLKHKHDKKLGLTKVSRARRSRNKTKWSHQALFAAQYILSRNKISVLDLQIISGV